jgi:hypothetical protein
LAEEIFEKEEPIWFSPNGTWLAFAVFNDTNVGKLFYTDYAEVNAQYPTVQSLPYPKVSLVGLLDPGGSPGPRWVSWTQVGLLDPGGSPGPRWVSWTQTHAREVQCLIRIYCRKVWVSWTQA